MRNAKIIACFFCLFVYFSQQNKIVRAQPESGGFVLNADQLADKKAIALNKGVGWKVRTGDDRAWAAKEFDDTDWQTITETRFKPDSLTTGEWRGRAWFRLRVKVDENTAAKPYILFGGQSGASEIYLDGQRLARFGTIGDGAAAVYEYNPNNLPIPVQFEGAGEHTIAVRFASETYADPSGWTARWLLGGGVNPGFSLSIREAGEWRETVDSYAQATSMRVGFLFVGILISLAFLHFMLYLFYRVERANLFYSIYAFSLGLFIFCNNLSFGGHLSGSSVTILRVISSMSFAAAFIGLLAFVYVAFERRLGKVFWTMTALWALNIALSVTFLVNFGRLFLLPNILIGLSFTFSIYRLVSALREKRPGAWIIFTGVQLLAFGMFSSLVNQFKLFDLPGDVFFLGEFAIVLAVPISVSIFLARNFARTNRDLKLQLAQVEQLSKQQIEHERQAAALRAENDRRAQELEEARQLQLSMLPRKLPNIPGLEIAAYMKPASEVGGDYYDFHTGADGTLTVAVGDATGHGLRAGSVVTATKSLFNAFAEIEDIPRIFRQSSAALKKMNLRGLFMAMTMLKIKGNQLSICAAGMPSALIYRTATEQVEQINLRALPLGSVSNFAYQEQQFDLSAGDLIVVMSDGFPEMFNQTNEMLGFEKAAQMLPAIAKKSAQEIISRFVETGEAWADARPADDDVTFVVLKIKGIGDSVENGKSA